MYALAQKANEVELIGGEPLGLLYKETAALFQQGFQTFLETFLIYFFLCFGHHVPGQLLHIGRVILHHLAYSASIRFAYLLAILLESGTNEGDPIFRRDAFEMDHLAKLVERHTATLEYILHQMFLAAKEAIRHILMVLPSSAQPFLYRQRVGELTYLLKFINAYDHANALLLGYAFGEIQNLFWRIVLGRYS